MRRVFSAETACVGDVRVAARFLWAPLVLVNRATGRREMRWLETAWVEDRFERFVMQWGRFADGWARRFFVDRPDGGAGGADNPIAGRIHPWRSPYAGRPDDAPGRAA